MVYSTQSLFICIVHLRSKGQSRVSQKLLSLPVGEVALCSIVKAELWAGIFRVQDPTKARGELEAFQRVFHSIPFDDQAAEHFGRIHAHLAVRGTSIGAADLLIAAIALSRLGLKRLSHNQFRKRVFSQYRALKNRRLAMKDIEQ